MIVDTSAIIAIVVGEDDAERFLAAMSAAEELAISAASLVEALIVAEAKGGAEAARDVQALLAELEMEVRAFDGEQALLAARAWARFGKGRHPAGLNLGDCFAYAAAQHTGEMLLYKGKDFAQTDVASHL